MGTPLTRPGQCDIKGGPRGVSVSQSLHASKPGMIGPEGKSVSPLVMYCSGGGGLKN